MRPQNLSSRCPKLFPLCAFVTLIGVVVTGAVSAETIRLTSGATLTGEILGHDDKEVRVSRRNGTIQIPYRMIRRVDPGGETDYAQIKELRQAWKDAGGAPNAAKKDYVRSPQRETRVSRRTRVDLYMTQWCPYCRKMEAFLKKNRIKYRRYNIDYDQSANRRYQELGGGGVPLLNVGGTVIRGFNPQAVLRAIQ